MNDKKIRLQKYLAECGIASRRKSEQYITAGLVKVNNKVIDKLGFCVNENDIVTVNDRIIKPINKVYIVLNKPEFYLCEKNDKWGRKVIYDLIKEKVENLHSVGRLDYNSKGILILTNDGDFTYSISHPSKEIEKVYEIETYDNISDKLIKNFIEGIKINDITYKAKKIKKIEKNLLNITLIEGKKREIREVFKFFNYSIKTLERISIGKLDLKDLNIKVGEYKYFKKEELIRMIYG